MSAGFINEQAHYGDPDAQEALNAMVGVQNAVFYYMCILAGQHGEPHELDAGRLREWIAVHPQANLADDVWRAVKDELAVFGMN